jgi:hypothetical protein
MAKSTITLSYSGRAEEPVEWEALLRIFDTIWGPEARSLPKYPKVIGAVHASWQDASRVEHEAESLDEVGQAYRQYETALISFRGSLDSGPRCFFKYWPAKAEASIEVLAGGQTIADQCVAAVRKEFPLIAKYVFISYDTPEVKLATHVATILEKRLAPGVSVFVAKRDIAPGTNPLKVMLEDQLLRAEALVALCSQRSKTSPWLSWESSAVWARGGLVVPLFINISPNEFNGPITLVCQGRDFFEVADLNSALLALVSKVCPGRQCEELTADEIKELNMLKPIILGSAPNNAPQSDATR